MKMNSYYSRLLAIVATTFATMGLLTPAFAYSVYHGVQADPLTGAVIWTNASFGVSAGPPPVPPAPPAIPNLSFFYFVSDVAAQAGFLVAPQCIVKVNLPNTVANAGPPPVPAVNAQDTVGNVGVAIGIAVSRPFPWAIVFDNAPPGHWNITKGAIVNLHPAPPLAVPSNAVAGTVAATGFQNLAAGNYGVTVINGTLQKCHR